MKIKILGITIILAGMICCAGCSNFLDTTPTDKISDKLVWESEELVQLNVNTFYAYIERYGVFGNPSQFNGNMTEGLTETLKYGASVPGRVAGDANNYVFTPEAISPATNLLSVWTITYERIRRVNEFLVGLQKYSKFTAEKNTEFEAQARFFRAFLYFQLAKRHGGVILYENLDMQINIDRSSAEATWDLIERDLDFAASELPYPGDVPVGRLTKGAAYAFKSRAMLYAERWQAAKDAADAVFELNKYKLTDKYADAYKGSNSESILQYAYLRTGPNHSFDKDYATFGEIEGQGGNGVPTQEMVESYERIDGARVDWTPWHVAGGTTTTPPYISLEPRFHATVIYPGSIWRGKTMENSVGGTNGRYMGYRDETYPQGRTVTGYYLKKFRDETNTDLATWASSHTWVEIRLAEVYLNRAEANFRLGNAGPALIDLNAIRKRTEVNLSEKDGLTGNDLFNAIRQERKIELAYEGHLYWDMRRWKLAHTEYNNYRVHGFKITNAAGGFQYEYIDCDKQDRKFLERTYVLPIPSDELANNSAIQQYDLWR